MPWSGASAIPTLPLSRSCRSPVVTGRVRVSASCWAARSAIRGRQVAGPDPADPATAQSRLDPVVLAALALRATRLAVVVIIGRQVPTAHGHFIDLLA